MLPSYRIVFEILRDIVRVVRGRFELKEARVKAREQKAFMNGLFWGVGLTAAFVFSDGSRTLVYGKNDPFRSWPISANELEEVAMGSETNM